MKRLLFLFTIIAIALTLALPFASITTAAGPEWVIVNPGDTLYAIATRHGVTIDALMRVNNLPNANFVYSGQRLLIPDPLMVFPNQPAQTNAPVAPAQPARVVYYTVRPGDTLAAIAQRHGVSLAAIAQANNLTNWNFVWYGQRLIIPGATMPAPVQPAAPARQVVAAPAAVNAPTGGKWIDINVSKQTITAYEGNVAVRTTLVSTGTAYHPTVLGTYKILTKYPAVHMRGGTPGVDYYDLPNVPYTMFFFRGYAIHGTYWHKNFGHPMSHGCVNLTIADAKWFYEWAPTGTTVVSHR